MGGTAVCKGFRLPWVWLMRQPEKRDGGDYRIVLGRGWRAVVCGSLKTQFSEANILFIVLRLTFVMHLPLRLIAARATYFLCFAKESKQRKATPTCRSASQTSLTAHPFFGACELAALRASSDKRTLVPEKRMLRSAGRRGGAAASNSCEALGSLKIGGWVSGCLRHRKQIKPLPRTPLPTAFSPPDNRRAGLRLRRRGQGRAVFCCVGFGGSGGRRFGRQWLGRGG